MAKPASYKIPPAKAREQLDRVFKSHDAGSFNQREKTHAAREAARALANYVDALRLVEQIK